MPRPHELNDCDIWLTRPEVADYFRRAVRTIEYWDTKGIGPKSTKIGRRRLYKLTDVRAFANGDQ